MKNLLVFLLFLAIASYSFGDENSSENENNSVQIPLYTNSEPADPELKEILVLFSGNELVIFYDILWQLFYSENNNHLNFIYVSSLFYNGNMDYFHDFFYAAYTDSNPDSIQNIVSLLGFFAVMGGMTVVITHQYKNPEKYIDEDKVRRINNTHNRMIEEDQRKILEMGR